MISRIAKLGESVVAQGAAKYLIVPLSDFVHLILLHEVLLLARAALRQLFILIRLWWLFVLVEVLTLCKDLHGETLL